jgi:hypothetical protein
MACIYLRHFSSFFASVPLLKGVFFRLSLFVNQPTVNFTIAEDRYSVCTVNSPLGGISPLMLASMAAGNGANTLATGNYIVNLSVGQECLNPAQSNLRGVASGQLARNCQLIVPSYVMNPVFESAYLSSEIKKISFEGTYNFNVSNRCRSHIHESFNEWNFKPEKFTDRAVLHSRRKWSSSITPHPKPV